MTNSEGASPDHSQLLQQVRGRLSSKSVSVEVRDALQQLSAEQNRWEPRLILPLINALDRQQEHAESRLLAEQLISTHPNNGAAWTRAAALAARYGLWDEAIHRYEQAIILSPPRRNEQLSIGLANALIKSRRMRQAITRIEEMHEAHPDSHRLAKLLGRAYVMTGQFTANAELAERHRHQWSEDLLDLFLSEISAKARSGLQIEVEQGLRALIVRAQSVRQIRLIGQHLDYLGAPACRQPYISFLKEAAILLRNGCDGEEERGFAEQDLRFALLEKDWQRYCDIYEQCDSHVGHPSWDPLFTDIYERLKFPAHDTQVSKVFGVGLSKTGTTSVESALQQLGFSVAHFKSPATGMMLEESDWLLFDALNDTPIAVDFERCYARYPSARFIYTVRPFDSWKKSLLNHFLTQRGTADWSELQGRNSRMWSLIPKIEGQLYFQYSSPEEAWDAHDRKVRAFFADKPENQFLIFDVEAGDGWQKLCSFLNVPIPERAFPHANVGKIL